MLYLILFLASLLLVIVSIHRILEVFHLADDKAIDDSMAIKMKFAVVGFILSLTSTAVFLTLYITNL